MYLEQPSHFPHRRPRAREEPGVEGPATAAVAAAAFPAFGSTFSAAFLALLEGGEGLLAAASASVAVLFAGGVRPPLESNSAVVASALLTFGAPSFVVSFFLRALAFT